MKESFLRKDRIRFCLLPDSLHTLVKKNVTLLFSIPKCLSCLPVSLMDEVKTHSHAKFY